MNFFSILRQHAAIQPNAIASISSRRTINYRRLWARTERATARLIGEWHVKPGDVIAYCGRGDADALMLYMAVARCGARLLPLSANMSAEGMKKRLAQVSVSILLHDDDTVFAEAPDVPFVTSLASLVAVRCHHQPAVKEDDTQVSLLSIDDRDGELRMHSLHDLVAQSALAVANPCHIAAPLFEPQTLTQQVLPILAARGTLTFD